MPVMIGVDPHKASHTAAALDEHGRLLGQQRIPATLDGYRQLRQWAGRWPQRCWVVEGAHGIGRALAQRLVGDGEPVVDVPAKLAARVRVLSAGHGRKSDPHDAVAVAVAARSGPSLRQVGVENQAVVLHLLTKRREDLVAARTQTINRLHRLLMDLIPGGARRNLTARRAAVLLSEMTPTGAPAVTRWQLATELVGDVRHLEQRIAAVETQIKAAVAQSNTSLLGLFGVGPVLAARFLGEVGDVRRFPSKHHFAAHTGTAPLKASSGQVHPPPAVPGRGPQAEPRPVHDGHGPGPPAQRRAGLLPAQTGRGQVPKEALRCLKRRLSDAVYRCLLADQHLQPSKTSAVLHDKEVATTTTSTIASRVLRQGRPSPGSPVRAPGVG